VNAGAHKRELTIFVWEQIFAVCFLDPDATRQSRSR
jgi:hypothetical protein